jgi:urea transport system ATP-binding protein
MDAATPIVKPLSETPRKALATENVTVDFSGFKAVQDLNFSLNEGELRFLIGPNGAGKTTLLDSICGRVKPTSGHVRFKDGSDLSRLQEHQIAQKGVARKFQTPSVFSSLSVWDNLSLALRGPRGLMASLRAKVLGDEKTEIEKWLCIVGLEEQANTLAGALSHGQKQWLEIGMTLAQKPDVILLDEPAAGMTDHETDQLGQLLGTLEPHQSILVVEHDMEFVRCYAQLVTVMHEGKILCEGSMDEVQANERVAEVYLQRRVVDA